MRKVILKMSVSIDGFVAGPKGEIDWIFRSKDAGVMSWLVETLGQAGVHIMGSRTYQAMAAHWPHSTDVLAAPMNQIPKVIFSRKGAARPDADPATGASKNAADAAAASPASDPAILRSWTAARVAGGDLQDEIRQLRQEPGNYILAHGGARFAGSLAAGGLIDEYRLLIHPLALGSGLPLFGDLTEPLHLRLAQSIDFSSGIVARVYQRT